MKVVLVTGGFDPLHSGHISYFKEAKKLGIPIIAILDSNSNPDNIDYPIPGCYNEHYSFVFHTLIHKKVIPLQHKLNCFRSKQSIIIHPCR